MDSESDNESGDYSYDESSDEDESTDSFENLSTTSRNWRKGNFNPRLFSFDLSGCGLSSTIKKILLSKHHLTSSNFFSIEDYLS